jgi:hypothetical protein
MLKAQFERLNDWNIIVDNEYRDLTHDVPRW